MSHIPGYEIAPARQITTPTSRRSGFRLDIGLICRLPLSTRGYLLYQAVGSLFVNAVINSYFAWQKHGSNAIPVFGWHASVLLDTCLTALLLSGLTVISGSWFVRRDRERGVVNAIETPPDRLRAWARLATLARALLFAIGFTLLSVPPALGLLVALGAHDLTFARFFAFKLGFALLLGALVTPLNAALVLAGKRN